MTSDLLKQRILAEVAERPSPTRAQILRNTVALAASGAATALAVFWIRGNVRPTGRSQDLMIGTAVGALVIAVAALVVAARRGRSMAGRSPALLLMLLDRKSVV